MKELFRQVIQLFILMVILIIPFLLFHERITSWWIHWQANPPSHATSFLVVTSLLAGDILLPVPSSLVCTFAGVQMGWLSGTLACWMGMNLGCIIAFALARRFGSPFVQRFSKPEELQRIHQLSQRYGPFVLVLTRGAPVFAEATVLFMGIHDLSWKRFLTPVIGTNLALAAFYCIFGEWANDNDLLSIAIGAAIAVPVLLIAAVRYSLRDHE